MACHVSHNEAQAVIGHRDEVVIVSRRFFGGEDSSGNVEARHGRRGFRKQRLLNVSRGVDFRLQSLLRADVERDADGANNLQRRVPQRLDVDRIAVPLPAELQRDRLPFECLAMRLDGRKVVVVGFKEFVQRQSRTGA